MHQGFRWAAFFGDAEREVRTASFEYAERVALVPDREVPVHTHENAHFVCVVRGTYVTGARNRTGTCGAGSVIYSPAGTTHRDRFRTERGRFFAISVAAPISSRIERVHPAPVFLDSLEIGSLIEQARREVQASTPFSDLILEGIGYELAGSVARWATHPDPRPPRWLLTVRDALHDRCTEKVSAGELAAIAGVHPIHLARAFRRYFACSPGEYLRRCRIERVRALLATPMPLAEVALEAGFHDQSQLTKAFRRATGMTPGMFRGHH
jgi:AraC family transcriptional regulator